MAQEKEIAPLPALPEDNRQYLMKIPAAGAAGTPDKIYNANMALANAQSFTDSVNRQAQGGGHTIGMEAAQTHGFDHTGSQK